MRRAMPGVRGPGCGMVRGRLGVRGARRGSRARPAAGEDHLPGEQDEHDQRGDGGEQHEAASPVHRRRSRSHGMKHVGVHGSRWRRSPRSRRAGSACNDALAMPADLADTVSAWYDRAARDLPWRTPGTGAWPVLVSEVMLQQTPVARVLPAWQAWLQRWPTPAALAAAAPGEAVRMWGKLGYPRRALRLHACARAIVDRFGGEVPGRRAALLESLPGIGELHRPCRRGVRLRRAAPGRRHQRPAGRRPRRRRPGRAGAALDGPRPRRRRRACCPASGPPPPAPASR